MNYSKLALAALLTTAHAFSMNETSCSQKKGYSIQDYLDSKPNLQICWVHECDLETLNDDPNKFTCVQGIQNIDGIEKMWRINLDGNNITLEGSPFLGLNLQCRVLTLNRNQISSVSPAFFAGLSHLKRLELNRNNMSELADNLELLSHLEVLELAGNPVVEDAAQIAKIIKALPHVNIIY